MFHGGHFCDNPYTKKLPRGRQHFIHSVPTNKDEFYDRVGPRCSALSRNGWTRGAKTRANVSLKNSGRRTLNSTRAGPARKVISESSSSLIFHAVDEEFSHQGERCFEATIKISPGHNRVCGMSWRPVERANRRIGEYT